MIGPNVTLGAIVHPLVAEERATYEKPDSDWLNRLVGNKRTHTEPARPITIDDRVWLCAGVTIGENSVIGAGSVVTRDIPPNMLAYGSPCRVIRAITDADRME